MSTSTPSVIGSNANKAQRDRSSLDEQLVRQFKYLDNSAYLFDEGDHDEANRLATTLRVLLHDTNSSVSLLKQLGIKDALRFIDTGLYRDRLNAAMAQWAQATNGMTLATYQPGQAGLVEMAPKNDGSFEWVAPLREKRFPDGHPHAAALLPPQPFDAWWTTPLVEGSDMKQFSRKSLVLIMANQDGGAHVDEALDKDYANLCVDHLGVQMLVTSDPDEGGNVDDPDFGSKLPKVSNNVAFACMRQIAFEVMLTLQRHYESEADGVAQQTI